MSLPRFPLLTLPTPLHLLPRVSEDQGVEVWIKRDDLTGLALGGNKGRKVEFLVADALKQGAEVVLTCGSSDSNFIRMLGAGCAVARLRCVAVVMDLPWAAEAGGPPASAGRTPTRKGNVVLGTWLGVEYRRHLDGTWDELFDHLDAAHRELSQTAKVYRVPVGGSTGVGAMGFYQAANELLEQGGEFDTVVTASSSGSTQTGLAMGLRGARVVGIACDAEPDLADEFVPISQQLAGLTGERALRRADFDLRFDWVGEAYGIPSEAGNDAIRYLARREGVFLDPVYSAKAFAGLRDLAKRGELGRRVLFWHTGGMPSLFSE